MSELLESRWQDTKTALLEGLEGNKSRYGCYFREHLSTWLRSTLLITIPQATLLHLNRGSSRN